VFFSQPSLLLCCGCLFAPFFTAFLLLHRFLFLLWLLSVGVGSHAVLEERELAKHADARPHLQEDGRVSSQVGQRGVPQQPLDGRSIRSKRVPRSTLSWLVTDLWLNLRCALARLFINGQGEAACQNADEQRISDGHLVANEEVAQSQVSIKHGEGLLKLVQSDGERGAVVAGHFARDLVQNAPGLREHTRLDEVCPGVDLSLLLNVRPTAELAVVTGKVARDRKTIAHENTALLRVLEDREATSERFSAQRFIICADLHYLQAFDFHELGHETSQLGLRRRCFARFDIESLQRAEGVSGRKTAKLRMDGLTISGQDQTFFIND